MNWALFTVGAFCVTTWTIFLVRRAKGFEIDVELLVDSDGGPTCYWALGHPPPRRFLRAVQRLETKICGEGDWVSDIPPSDVRHGRCRWRAASKDTQGAWANDMVLVDAPDDYEYGFPVTLLDI